MERILIKCGRVFDGNAFACKDIFTENGIISKIEPNITDTAEFVFDAKGMIVSPGLVDTHVHIKGLSSDDFGINAEMSCLPFGVTAALDAGSSHGDRAFLDSLVVKNIVFVAQGLEEEELDFKNTEKLLEKYGDKAIGLKAYFDTEISAVRDIKPLEQVCAYARKKGIKVMVHCSNSPVPMADIVKTLSCGDILTHIYHGGENNCTESDFEAFKNAKERGVIMDAGFAGHVHTDFAVLRRAIAEGFLPDTISTDITKLSAYKRGGRYGMTMCMSMMRSLGVAEEEIFKRVTLNPAVALGKKDEWGALCVGRAADIAVFDYIDEGFDLTDKAGNNFKSQYGYRCVLTVLNGQILYKD